MFKDLYDGSTKGKCNTLKGYAGGLFLEKGISRHLIMSNKIYPNFK